MEWSNFEEMRSLWMELMELMKWRLSELYGKENETNKANLELIGVICWNGMKTKKDNQWSLVCEWSGAPSSSGCAVSERQPIQSIFLPLREKIDGWGLLFLLFLFFSSATMKNELLWVMGSAPLPRRNSIPFNSFKLNSISFFLPILLFH